MFIVLRKIINQFNVKLLLIQISNEKSSVRQKLCFNCTGEKHRVSECKNEQARIICNRKRHTSIFDKDKCLLLTTNENKALLAYPVVSIKVDRIICIALLDTAYGSSNVSASLVNTLSKQPARRESKKIKIMLYTATSNINIYNFKTENLQSDFEFKTKLNAVDKDVL